MTIINQQEENNIESMRTEYEKLQKQVSDNQEEIAKLAEDEKVVKYFKLCSENKDLIKERDDLYIKMKVKEYDECNHIWIKSFIDYDADECRSTTYCGCIKCGINELAFFFADYYDFKYLSLNNQAAYKHMVSKGTFGNKAYMTGIVTKVACNLSLASAIYSKIKEQYPEIDDETARKYFEIALDDIRNINVNEKRQASRIKRLSLETDFKDWYASDIKN